MTQIQAIAATTVTKLQRSPFLNDNAIRATSVPGATLYGVNRAARRADQGNYQLWTGDGTQRVWNEDDISVLADADTAALSGGSTLRVILEVNGTVYQRVAPTAVPTAGEFAISADSRGTATVAFTDTVPLDAETITIDDGTNTPTEFEFDPAGDGLAGAGTEVDTAGETTKEEIAASFVAAVNSVGGTLTVTAYDNGDGTVTLISDTAGTIADLAVTGTVTGTTITDFTGDEDGKAQIYIVDAPNDGAEIEVYLQAAADINDDTVAANVPLEVEGYQYVYATAAVQLSRLTR